MTGVRLFRRRHNGRRRTALRLPSAPERLSIKSREMLDKRYDHVERTLMPRRDLRAREGSAGEVHVRSVTHGPAIARRRRSIFHERDLGGVGSALLGETL